MVPAMVSFKISKPLGVLSLVIVVIVILLSCSTIFMSQRQVTEETVSRERRGAVYVQGSIFQFAYGLQVPTDVPNKTININVGLQANYMLPGNVTQFHDARRERREVLVTHDMYLEMEQVLEECGYHGRECLLRSICEVARVPLARHQPGLLLEEILHLLLTPSLGFESCRKYPNDICDSSLPSDEEREGDVYLSAEKLGQDGGDCQLEFPLCSETPLEQVSVFEQEESPNHADTTLVGDTFYLK